MATESRRLSMDVIKEAAARIAPFVTKTPVLTSSAIDRLAGRQLFFKCELFQRTGSFKFRGATNAVQSLSEEEAAKGVITHSSGNHGQALACAAAMRGIPAQIVVPDNAPLIKRQAMADYGAKLTLCEPTNAARQAATDKILAEGVAPTLVHPSNDPRVIAGQGTMALELYDQVKEMLASAEAAGRPFDAVVVPIGGGGMTAGVATAIKGLDPSIRVFAAEPAMSDDAYRSKEAGEILAHREGQPNTIADGLRTTLGDNTFPVVRDLVERVILVEEDAIISSMRLIWERMKLAIEPSAGVGIAAALSDEFRGLEGIDRVGVVLCGGNIDVSAGLPWMASDIKAPAVPPPVFEPTRK